MSHDTPIRCGCRAGGGPGGPDGDLCPTAFRLRGRLEAERALAEHTGRWDEFHAVMRQATAHVTQMTLHATYESIPSHADALAAQARRVRGVAPVTLR